MAPTTRTRRRSRRGPERRAGRVLAAASLTTIFAAAMAAGAALHLDVPAARRLARRAVNAALADALAGDVRAESIDALGLGGFAASRVTVHDPEGHRVVVAEGVTARVDAFALARALLIGGELRVAIPAAAVARADVSLDRGPSGRHRIVDAFTPRRAGAPGRPGRAVRVLIPNAHIGEASVHGDVTSAITLEGEVHEVFGGVDVDPDGVRVFVDEARVIERHELPAPLDGALVGSLRTREEGGILLTARFDGRVGAAPVVARADIDGDRVFAAAEAARITPFELASIAPGAPLVRPVSARVDLAGTLPRLDVHARARELDRPDASLAIDGALRVVPELVLDGDFTARAVDPGLFDDDLPTAAIDARGHVVANLAELHARINLHTEPTLIGGTPAPAIDAELDLDRSGLRGDARLHEPGAPIEGRFALTPGPKLEFEARANVPSLRRVPRLGLPVDGRARLHVAGGFRDGRLDARVDGALAIAVADAPIALDRGDFTGSVGGPIAALHLDLRVRGARVDIAGSRFAHLAADVTGPPREPRVHLVLDDPRAHVDAVARIDTRVTAARDVHVTIARDGDSAELIAAEIAGGREPHVRDAVLRGAGVGSASASFALRDGDLVGELRGEDLDLGRLARLAGFPQRIDGLADLHVAIEGHGPRRRGRASVAIENGTIAGISGLSTHLEARLDGAELHLDGFAHLLAPALPSPRAEGCRGPIAAVHIDEASVLLRGPLVAARTWTRAAGSARLATESADLACLANTIPLPRAIAGLAGAAAARVTITRADSAALPSIHDLALSTRGLVIVAAPPEDGAPTWASTALDLDLRADLDATGTADLALTLRNAAPIAELTAHAKLDPATLFADAPRRTAALRKAPFDAHLIVPPRPIAALATLPIPGLPHAPPIAGTVALEARATGTFDDPRAIAFARGLAIERAATSDAPEAVTPTIDVDLYATYADRRATLGARARARDVEIAEISAEIDGALPDLLRADAPPPFAVTATLHDLPLVDVPFLAERNLGGTLNGSLHAEHRDGTRALDAHLEAFDFQVSSDVFFETARLDLAITPAGDARADAALVARDGGVLRARADAGISWTSAARPAIDPARRASINVTADRFRLAAAQPFVAGSIQRLDGWLDGRASLAWTRFGDEDTAHFDGRLQVTEGIAELPLLGQEIRDARLTVIADPSGVLRFEEMVADTWGGRIRAAASIRIADGRIVSAAARVAIPKGNPSPIRWQGLPLGRFDGAASAAALFYPDRILVDVAVPRVHITLPPSIGRSVQSLDDEPDITIHPPITPPELQPEGPPRPIEITLDVGEIDVEGKGLDLTITDVTKLEIMIADEVRASGELTIRRGRVEALDHIFEIDRATIRFRPDERVTNPYVSITASWEAPDGTRVYIDYTGTIDPITDDKITFRSEPSRSRQEILALLVFGPEQADLLASSLEPGSSTGPLTGLRTSGAPTTSDSGVGTATGLGTAIASTQVSALFERLLPLRGLSVRVGRTGQGAFTTSVGYEINRSLTATATYSTIDPNSYRPTVGGSANQPGATTFGLDWRFHRNWHLRGSVGVGIIPSTGIDLLWIKRY